MTAALDDFGPAAIHETGEDQAPCWRVFFGSAAARDEAQQALTGAFAARGLVLTSIDVPDEDWAARSQATLRAVRIGRILVAPPWDVPDRLPSGMAVVVIQPSTGFGTGHHETTRLCVELLQEIDCGGATVFDVGAGSGVLALAAAALGASAVEGIDTDPDAVTNALENRVLNPRLAREAAIRFSVEDVRSASGDARAGHEPNRADIVLANLTGALLTSAAGDLVARAKPGGALIVSGFQQHEVAGVITAFGDAGAVVERRRAAGDWQAAVFRRR